MTNYSLNKPFLAKYAAIEIFLASVAGASSFVLPLPSAITFGTAFTAGAVSLKHWIDYYDCKDLRKLLNEGNFFNVTDTDVQKIRQSILKSKKVEDNYYVGKGFPWTAQHMGFYERIKNDATFKAVTDHENIAGGKHYIHNLGFEDEVPCIANLKEHTVIAGEPGSGKTVLLNLLTSQFIRDGEAVCIIDPKGDKALLNAVYSLAKAVGREKDFQFFSLAHSENSITFDPLANSLKAEDAATRIAALLPDGGNSKAFTDFCWGVLKAVGDSLLVGGHKLNLRNLYRHSTVRGMKELHAINSDLFEQLTPNSDKWNALIESQHGLEQYIGPDGSANFSKMVNSLKPVMASLASGELGSLLNPKTADTSWEKIIKEKKIIYFNLSSLIDNFNSSLISKLIVQDLIAYLGQLYAYEKKSTRIKLVCDEFYSIAYKGFGDALNKGRAAGLQTILGLQTSADIAEQLGREMVEVIYGSLPNKIYLRVSSKLLAERFSELTPEAEYTTLQKMRATSATPQQAGLFSTSNTAMRQEKRVQRLVTPEMITGLPQGQAFLYNKGMLFKIAMPMLKQASPENYFDSILNAGFSIKRSDLTAPFDKMYAQKTYQVD